MFCNMYMAYDTLHPAVQRAVDELEAHNAFPDTEVEGEKIGFGQTDPNLRLGREAVMGVAQPVVVIHPETKRKALYVNRTFTRKIIGMPELQSRHLLDMLHEHCANAPEFQVRFSWKVGAIAVWDNRCTLHYAVSDYASPRTMWRVTTEGTGPLYGPSSVTATEARKSA